MINILNDNKIKESKLKIKPNKGINAGGAKTNYYGKYFEEITNNQIRLLNEEYIKNNLIKNPKKIYDYYLSKILEDKTIIFVLQSGLKKYLKIYYNIELFRYPDEAYIIKYKTNNYILKILEKKEQQTEGSVETKLWSGPSLKREYELVLGNNWKIDYGFCVNSFLKKKLKSNKQKYIILNAILNENNIPIFFGEDDNYFEMLDIWVNNSL